MSLKILEEKNNALFKRKEVKATLESEITPSRSNILELLSKHFSVSPENIKIRAIRGNFGIKVFNIEANIYESVEEKNIVEIKKKKETTIAKEASAQ
jgi:ribosomal protein S24E